MTCPVWSNRFNWCALAAGFLAAVEGRIGDSRYVQKLADEFYESGAFRDRVSSFEPSPPPESSPARPDGLEQTEAQS